MTILLKCLNHQSNLHIQWNFYQNSNGIFNRNRTYNPKVCMEQQKICFLLIPANIFHAPWSNGRTEKREEPVFCPLSLCFGQPCAMLCLLGDSCSLWIDREAPIHPALELWITLPCLCLFRRHWRLSIIANVWEFSPFPFWFFWFSNTFVTHFSQKFLTLN